jgi:Flavin containing amine oxidoreductase
VLLLWRAPCSCVHARKLCSGTAGRAQRIHMTAGTCMHGCALPAWTLLLAFAAVDDGQSSSSRSVRARRNVDPALRRSGYTSLWENMVSRDGLDVHLGCAVTNIARGEGGKQTVTYNQTVVTVGDDGEDASKTEEGKKLEVDCVVVRVQAQASACLRAGAQSSTRVARRQCCNTARARAPATLSAARAVQLTVAPPKLLTPAEGDPAFTPIFTPTPEEEAIFKQLQGCHFRVSVARIDAMPAGKPSHPGEVWLKALQEFDGHVRYISWSALDLFEKTIEVRPAVMTYQILKDRPSNKTKKEMRDCWQDDINNIGLNNAELLYVKNWCAACCCPLYLFPLQQSH